MTNVMESLRQWWQGRIEFDKVSNWPDGVGDEMEMLAPFHRPGARACLAGTARAAISTPCVWVACLLLLALASAGAFLFF